MTDHAEPQSSALAQLDLLEQALAATTTSMVICAATRADHPIVYANQGFLALTGYTLHEVLGQRCDFLQGAGSDPEDSARLRRAIETGTNVAVTIRNYRKDGAPFWNRIELSMIRDATGAVTHLVSVQADVTDPVATEERLRAATERYDLACRGSNDGFWDWDIETNADYFSERWNELLGYTSEELTPHYDTWAALLHPDDRERVEAAVAAHLQQRTPYDVEYRMRTQHGDYRWFHARGQAIWDAGGKPVRMAGSIQDINAWKELEFALKQARSDLEGQVLVRTAELRASNRALREEALERRRAEVQLFRLAETLTGVFWLTTPDRKQVLYVSPAYEQIWGRSCASLYADANAFLDGVHADDLEHVKALLPLTNRQPTNYEFRVVRPDTTVRWVWTRTFPIPDGNGNIDRIAGVAEDITDRKNAERLRIQQALDQRNAMLRELHHRIKNHLQSLIGLIGRHKQRDPALAAVLNDIATQASSIAIVHGMQGRTGSACIAIAELLQQIADSFRTLAENAITLHLDDAMTEHAICAAEAVPIALIANELIQNATKHGDPRHGIEIVAALNGLGCRIAVSNHGRLPADFDFSCAQQLGNGLALINLLVPPEGANVSMAQAGERVVAELHLTPPVLVPIGSATGS